MASSVLTLGEKFRWIEAVEEQPLDPTIFDKRSLRGLERAHIRTWGELGAHTDMSLRGIPHVGEVTVGRIKRALAMRGANISSQPGPGARLPQPAIELEPAADFEPDLGVAVEWASVLVDNITLSELTEACLNREDVPRQVDAAVKNLLRLSPQQFLRHEVTPLAERIGDLVSTASNPGLLASREFGRTRTAWRTLGKQRGLTGEAVRQRLAKDALVIRGLLASDRFRAVRWATKQLQADFGELVPADSPIVDHWRTRLGEHSFEALRWLARYTYDHDWLLRGPNTKISELVHKLHRAIGDEWLVRAEDVVAELEHPVRPEASRKLLAETGTWRDIGDGWLVRWDGTLQDKAARVLELIGRPMTPAELVEAIGYGSEATLKNKPRYLVRADMQFRMALPEWGYEEYEGIVTEIKQRIQRGGGVASRAAIIDEFTKRFGNRVSSIITNLNLPIFDVDGDSVRLASSATFVPNPPSMIAGAIQTYAGWGERHIVAELNMKGYSFRLDPHIAWANGIRPSDSLLVPINDSASLEASVIWRATNSSGDVEIGRVRPWLEERGIGAGEDLLLCPTPGGVTIYVGEAQIASARDAFEATAPSIHPDIAALMEDL